MRRIIVDVMLMAGGAFLLTGCGMADSHSPVPAFMRAKASEPPPPSPHPMSDTVSAKGWMRCSRAVRVSLPHRDVHGSGWTACVRAELTSATGKPPGAQTCRITISGGVIIDRWRVEAEDNCASESYEPL
jgi:hypothetical protein